MKLYLKTKVWPIIFLALGWAATASAAGLVPCRGSGCTPCYLMKMVSDIINFMTLDVAFPLAGLLFLIGGLMMVMSSASENNYKKGKTIIVNTLIGVVIVVAAWAIINTLIVTIGSNIGGVQVEKWWNIIDCVLN